MSGIREMIRNVIEDRILPGIERDGISRLILPEQITPADCAEPIRHRRACYLKHLHHELGIGLTGRVPFCVDNKMFVFTDGRLLLVPAGTPHMADKGSGRQTTNINLNKTPSVLWLHASAFGIAMRIGYVVDNSYLLNPPLIYLGRDFSRLLSRLTEEVRSRPANYKRLGRYILLEFVERCLRVATDDEAVGIYVPDKVGLKNMPDMVRASLEFIYSHYMTPINLDDIADAADTSASHLIKRFKTALGQTPVAYLLKVRMVAARELLTTDIPVSEVARIAGIHDPAYFSRVFKHIEGVSPLAYRRRMTRKASVARAAARGRKSR